MLTIQAPVVLRKASEIAQMMNSNQDILKVEVQGNEESSFKEISGSET